MASFNDPTDPRNMTPEERLAEVAAILAAGVLRLHRRAAIPATPDAPINSEDSAQKGLDSRGETRLSGPRG